MDISRTVKKLIIGALIAMIIIVVGFYLLVNNILKGSNAFQVVKKQITADDELISRIGNVEDFGFFVSGEINPDPTNGNATFNFTVNGENGTSKVKCELVLNSDGIWVIETINYYD